MRSYKTKSESHVPGSPGLPPRLQSEMAHVGQAEFEGPDIHHDRPRLPQTLVLGNRESGR